MLCEIQYAGDSFLLTWLVLTLIAFVSICAFSGILFYYYYWPGQVTYAKWRNKSNPTFPSPNKIRDEVRQTVKGMFTATFCPAASLWLVARGKGQGYCGLPPGGLPPLLASFFVVWIVTDFWEFFYHRLGHTFAVFWSQHKHHHVFFNPTPFAVIADEYIDQFFRSALMLVFPLVMPTNIDVMFFTYAIFFYAYGVYLHWGYEFEWLDAHNPVINTAFQHYCHHAKAILYKPYHCGFFFKLWDQLSGAMYPEDKCFCAKCARAKGERTMEQFQKVVVPDYRVMLSLSFWLHGMADGKETAMTEEEIAFSLASKKKAS